MNSPWIVLLGLAVVVVAYLRSQRKTHRQLAAQQQAVLGAVLEELTSLRSALVASGAVERAAKLPPAAPPPALPSVVRNIVSVTRDDDPVHTRPTVEAPPPAGEARAPEEPPSTKPSQRREIRAALPSSAPRPVPFDDQVGRAMRRLEMQVRVPPDVEARWMERLAALRTELGITEDAAPTDEQVEAMIRELYEAEADVKDARVAAPPLDATLASAVSPIAVRIAQAAPRSDDAEGEATLRREGDRSAALPRANDDSEEDRDTGEDMTKVYSRRPGEADALIPGVEVKARPATLRPPHRPPRPLGDPLAGVEPERPKSSAARTADAFRSRGRPTLFGGLSAPRPPRDGEQKGGDER